MAPTVRPVWWVWLIVGWVALSVVAALVLGVFLRRARDIDRHRGGPPC